MNTLELKIGSGAWTDYSSLIGRKKGFDISLANDKWQSTRDSIEIELVYSSDLVTTLLTTTSTVRARLYQDSTLVFTGIVQPLDGIEITNSIDYYSITIDDYSVFFDRQTTDRSTFIGYSLCNPSNVSKSLVHGILSLVQTLSGETISTYGLPNLNQGGAPNFLTNVVIPSVVVQKGTNLWTCFRELLWTYGWGFRFDAQGRFCMFSWATNVSLSSIDYHLSDDPLIGGQINNGTLRVSAVRSDSDVGVLYSKYYKYAEKNTTLFTDPANNLRNFTGEIVGFENRRIKPSESYAITCNLFLPDDVVEGSYEVIKLIVQSVQIRYQEQAYERLTYKGAKRLAAPDTWYCWDTTADVIKTKTFTGNGSIPSLHLTGGLTVALSTSASKVVATLSNTVTIPELTAFSSEFYDHHVYNHQFYIDDIYITGIAILKYGEQTISVQVASKPGSDEMSLDYCFNQQYAQAFSNLYAKNVLSEVFKYEFDSRFSFPIGSVVEIKSIQHNIIGTGVVTGKKWGETAKDVELNISYEVRSTGGQTIDEISDESIIDTPVTPTDPANTLTSIPIGLYLSESTKALQFDSAGVLEADQAINAAVLSGTNDITDSCTVTATPSSGITGHFASGELAVYIIDSATKAGYIDFKATVNGAQYTARCTITLENKVTWDQLINGFDIAGGTTTPTVPTIATKATLRNIYVTWDKQANATGKVYHELQVTSDISGAPNPAGWTGIYYGPATEFLDAAKALGGTTANPVATTYWYRCRRVVGANVSAWSTSMSAVARAANAGDIEAGSILADKIDAAVLNALIANINQSLTVSAATGWTAGYQAVYTSDPLNKYRAYLDEDEIAIEKCTASASNGSGGWTATAWIKYGRLTSTDLMLGGAGIISVLEGTSDVNAGGVWNFGNVPTYNSLPLFYSGNGGSGSGNNADKVRSVTPGALGLALLALAGTLGTGWSTALAAACNAGGRSLLGLSALGTNWATALATALGTGWTTMLAAQPLSKFAPAAGGLWTGSVISANTTVPSMAVGETRVYKCETNDISITLTLPASGTYYVKRWYYGLYTFPLGGGTYTNNNVIGALDSGGNYGGGGTFTMTSGAGRMIEILRIA